jgi:hypothetical protein
MSATNIATFKLTRYSATVAKALQISVAKAQPDEPRDTLASSWAVIPLRHSMTPAGVSNPGSRARCNYSSGPHVRRHTKHVQPLEKTSSRILVGSATALAILAEVDIGPGSGAADVEDW